MNNFNQDNIDDKEETSLEGLNEGDESKYFKKMIKN